VRTALLASIVVVQAAQAADDFGARRRAVMARASESLVLLESSSTLDWQAPSFRQDASFYFLTGLPNAERAVLVIDGPAKESWLFAGAAPGSTPFVPSLQGREAAFVAPGAGSERTFGIEHVVPLERLDAFIASRPGLPLSIDIGSSVGSLPASEDLHAARRKAAHERWPESPLKDATPLLQAVRAVKDAGEIALLEKAAQLTSVAFHAGVAAIRPGARQRRVEAAVVGGCFGSGAEGPSFWPWVRSGAQAGPVNLYESLADYHNLDRTLSAGDLVRLDLGCEHEHYKADYGRTIPVSGRFDDGQREALAFLNRAYQAGVAALRPAATPADVNRATTSYVLEHRAALKTPWAREAAAPVGEKTGWFLHGIGLDLLEDAPRVFEPGNVICFEPRLTAHDQSVFVEDTFVITADGHRQISPALPTSPAEIESEMAGRRRR
jgi:Xaa-Pro aminopeptidase